MESEQEIRALVRQLEQGWNAGSGEAFAAPFAEDSDYVVVNGEHVRGREQNRMGHQRIFDTVYRGSHNSAHVESIRFLRPDVALAHVRWQLRSGPAGEERDHHAYGTLVCTRTGDRWEIAALQNTPIVSH